MIKRPFYLSLVLVMLIASSVWGADISVKVFENGATNVPIAVSGAKVDVYGGFGYRSLLFSGVSGSGGALLLSNVPVGKEVMVKLTIAGYITQYDFRSFSGADIEKGAILWIGSEANIKAMYNNLGETFDPAKGQIYLDINDEFTGEGIEGVQFAISSGKAFDLGKGEYLIANAGGGSLKVGFMKPGYAFDIASVTIPLFPGAMTQYYVTVQTGGSAGSLYESGQITKVTSAQITGFIKRLSDAVPISGVSVAFTDLRGNTVRPGVVTDGTGFYKQTGFLVYKIVKITPTEPPWKFRQRARFVIVVPKGGKADFLGY